MLFERAYVQDPVCNPSRSSFLTGLRLDQTGVTDNATLLRDKLPDVVTFPQLHKDNGSHSAAFGKIVRLGGGCNESLKAKWMDLRDKACGRCWLIPRDLASPPRSRSSSARVHHILDAHFASGGWPQYYPFTSLSAGSSSDLKADW